MRKIVAITAFCIILFDCVFCRADREAVVFADPATGLMWQGRDNGSDISWFKSKEYCDKLEYGGYSDWRMPTQNELATLYRLRGTETGDFYILPDIKISACCLWADDVNGRKVASFDFSYGNPEWGYPLSTVDARILAVRNVK